MGASVGIHTGGSCHNIRSMEMWKDQGNCQQVDESALRFISCLAQHRFTQLCYTHIRNGEKQHVKSWMVLLSFQKITLLQWNGGGRSMKAHILAVDDDPRITDLLRLILSYEGYSVAIAASGRQSAHSDTHCAGCRA